MSRFRNLEFGGESDENFQPEVTKDESYYLNEARAAFQDGNFEAGLRSYSKVLEHNPKNPEPWTGQVRMLIELGEYREAKVWADKALEQFPREPELLAAKAVALGRMGDRKGAMAFSDASVEERGNTPYIWLARGDVMLSRKEKAAEYCINKALAIAGQDWFFAWLASRIYFFYRKYSLALRLAETAVARQNRGSSWLQMGMCQRAVGLIGSAENSFEQAAQFESTHAEAQTALLAVSNSNFFTRLADLLRGLFSR